MHKKSIRQGKIIHYHQPEVMSNWFWHFSDAVELDFKKDEGIFRSQVASPLVYRWGQCLGRWVCAEPTQPSEPKITDCSCRMFCPALLCSVISFCFLIISGKSLSLPIAKISQRTTTCRKQTHILCYRQSWDCSNVNDLNASYNLDCLYKNTN